MSIILSADPKDGPDIADGKPYTDVIHSPPGVDDTWFDLYDKWIYDDTGEVQPPPGYEGWSVERALKDYKAEYNKLEDHIFQLWQEANLDKDV